MRERILDLLDPNRSVLLYLLGTVAITLLIQVTYDWANEPGTWKGGYTLTVIALIILAIAIFGDSTVLVSD